MIDANWKRWIKASLFKFYNDRKGSTNLYLEGEDRSKLKNLDSWIELSITGPDTEQISKDLYYLDTQVTVMCCTKTGGQIYLLDTIVGQYLSITGNVIPIYKIGNQTGDDPNALIGCLDLRPEPIRTMSWGTDTADIPITRTSIEANYRMEISTGD